MNLPSQEYLQSRIDYNPETGEAKWKPVDESYGYNWKRFNNNTAGKIIPNNRIRLGGKQYTLSRILYKLIYNKELQGEIIYTDGDSSNLRISNFSSVSAKIINTAPISFSYIPMPNNINLHYDCKTGILTRNNKIAGTLSKSTGYRSVRINNTRYMEHRVAWYLYYNVDPMAYQIDHIDGNKSNNCINNLRLATSSFNVQQSVKHAVGASINKHKWVAKIAINNVSVNLGSYDTKEEAQTVYETALAKYKPIYQFTIQEQELLDKLYRTYPNCDPDLQRSCHDLHVKAVKHYVDAAIVQTPNLEYNSSS